jgi:hypothetical protein
LYNVLQVLRFILAVFLALLASTLLHFYGIVRFGNAENALLIALMCWLLGFPLRRFSRHFAEWSPKASGKIHAAIGACFAIGFLIVEIMPAKAADLFG